MKKKGKKLISIALTVAMIAGLTACGKGNGGNGNGGSSAADASLAKQYVFKEQALDLNMDSDNMNIDLLTKKGDTIYLLFETYVQNSKIKSQNAQSLHAPVRTIKSRA